MWKLTINSVPQGYFPAKTVEIRVYRFKWMARLKAKFTRTHPFHSSGIYRWCLIEPYGA